MICQYCQINPPHSGGTGYLASSCRDCIKFIFNNDKIRRVTENGKVIRISYLIENTEHYRVDIWFEYDRGQTHVIESGAGWFNNLLTFEQVMPINQKFLDKVQRQLKLWQVFS